MSDPNYSRSDRFYSDQMALGLLGEIRQRNSYVCTICRKAHPPTYEVNCYCVGCGAPLKGSIQKITELKRLFSQVDGDKDKVKSITQTIQLVRQMKIQLKQYNIDWHKDKAAAHNKRYEDNPTYIPTKEIGLYDVHLKNGQVLNVRCESTDDVNLLIKKANKMKAVIKFAGTEQWHKSMNEIRSSIIEVKKNNKSK